MSLLFSGCPLNLKGKGGIGGIEILPPVPFFDNQVLKTYLNVYVSVPTVIGLDAHPLPPPLLLTSHKGALKPIYMKDRVNLSLCIFKEYSIETKLENIYIISLEFIIIDICIVECKITKIV